MSPSHCKIETSEVMKLIPDEHFDLRNAAISWYPAPHLSFPASGKRCVKTEHIRGLGNRNKPSKFKPANSGCMKRCTEIRGNPLESYVSPIRDTGTANLQKPGYADTSNIYK